MIILHSIRVFRLSLITK